MKRSERLNTLARLAGSIERAARTRLAHANQDVSRKLNQEQQLRDYESEYSNRWIASGRRGIEGTELQRIGAFRNSLQRAISTQEGVLAEARTNAGHAAMFWSKQRNRLNTLEDLVERARGREYLEREKRLQREIDELAMRKRRTLDMTE